VPHVTRSYAFEDKVFTWADDLSLLMTGHHSAFILKFGGNGRVRTLEFGDIARYRIDKQSVDAKAESYLFFDPFDYQEDCWISWKEIDRCTMERLIGRKFEDSDFGHHLDGTLQLYHSTWSLMF